MNTINILGINYTIEYVECVDKNEAKFGMTDFFNCKILIDKNLTPEKKEQVLLHEIIHCICQELNLFELGEDENKVQSLAVALHLTLKKNFISSFSFEKEQNLQQT